MLFKYSGKYVNIYFNIKITFQMQEQIRLLQEGLEDVRNQIARSPAATTASPAVQLPPPTRHTYQDFAEGAPR